MWVYRAAECRNPACRADCNFAHPRKAWRGSQTRAHTWWWLPGWPAFRRRRTEWWSCHEHFSVRWVKVLSTELTLLDNKPWAASQGSSCRVQGTPGLILTVVCHRNHTRDMAALLLELPWPKSWQREWVAYLTPSYSFTFRMLERKSHSLHFKFLCQIDHQRLPFYHSTTDPAECPK